MPAITEQDGHGRILSTTTDNGDGTGTRTLYGPDGQVTGTEQVTGLPVSELPVSELPSPDPLALLAEIGTDLAAIPATATSTQMRTALRTVGQKITDAIPT